MAKPGHSCMLSAGIPLAGDEPPTEFRIFRAGLNPTTEGDLVFDEASADAVLSAFAARGNDLVIDLQHDSVDPNARAMRSDAADARGYCKLEVRNGELWAVDVRWSPDGETRLRERRQKYISPIVLHRDGHITEIYNLALVADPATNYAAPLMLSARLEKSMDPEMVKKALEALTSGDAEGAAAILQDMIAAAASGGEAPPEVAAEESDPPEAEGPPEKEDDEAEAMASALRSELRVESSAAVIAEVKRLRSEVHALTLAREADERNERVDLVGELVKLGAELPCTAWADPEAREPSVELAAMPLAKLRARVDAFRKARPAQTKHEPPRAEPSGVAALSAYDQKIAASIKDDAARNRFVELRLSHGSKAQ